MCDRRYTAENVLDLVTRVFNIAVISNKDKTEHVSEVTFPHDKGWMRIASAGKGKDHYDGLYMLLYQIATIKHTGKVPDNMMQIREDEGSPAAIAIGLLEEKRNIEEPEGND